MKSSKVFYYWLSLFAICFLAYQQIQDNIRPGYTGENYIIEYFLGIAPNFFPGVGIPALFFVLIPTLTIKHKTNKYLNEKKHITANLISLIGLVSWEFLQTLSRSLNFDWNDIVWTMIGAIVFQLIWIITPYSYKVNYEEINLKNGSHE